jgi:hypothetical protein
MRLGTGWLAGCLAVAVTLLSGTAWAQNEVPPADPIYPFPLYHDRPETGGLYAATEFMFFRQTNPLKPEILAIRGVLDSDGSISAATNTTITVDPLSGNIFAIPGQGLPGTFIGSGKIALTAEQAAGPGTFVPGYRFTLGWRFEDGVAVDFTWMHLFNARYTGGATLAPFLAQSGQNLADTFLFAPVYNFPNNFAGPVNKLAVGNPLAAYGIWDGASIMAIRFDQHYDEYNLNFRKPILETDCNRCYCLTGLRRAWLWERFKWTTIAENFDGSAGPQDVAIYNNVLSQPMYGPYIGAGDECYLGHGASVSIDFKAAALVDFVREIDDYQLADRTYEAKRSKRVFNFVPELEANISLWWYPIEGVQIRVGYNALAFFNTIASPDPVSFDFQGLDAPYEHKFLRLLDGFNGGIGFIF